MSSILSRSLPTRLASASPAFLRRDVCSLSSIVVATLALSLLLAAGAEAHATDAELLLQQSDAARGASATGLTWDVSLLSQSPEKQDQYQLKVRTIGSASMAEIVLPLSSKGSKMLQVNSNLWLSKPGLRKAVPISPRQRLSGLIAIGDVAATNYARDYQASYLRRESVQADECDVLDLVSKGRNTTYDHIIYWVSAKRHVALKAEFYSLSGKLLKAATFEYDNSIATPTGRRPFVSKMTVVDAVSSERSVLEFSNARSVPLGSADFNVDTL